MYVQMNPTVRLAMLFLGGALLFLIPGAMALKETKNGHSEPILGWLLVAMGIGCAIGSSIMAFIGIYEECEQRRWRERVIARTLRI